MSILSFNPMTVVKTFEFENKKRVLAKNIGKKVKTIKFDVGRYGKKTQTLRFPVLVDLDLAIDHVERYLSLPLSLRLFESLKRKDDIFDCAEAQFNDFSKIADCLGSCTFLEAAQFNQLNATIQCAS